MLLNVTTNVRSQNFAFVNAARVFVVVKNSHKQSLTS